LPIWLASGRIHRNQCAYLQADKPGGKKKGLMETKKWKNWKTGYPILDLVAKKPKTKNSNFGLGFWHPVPEPGAYI
jgi:hypothetical protein